MKNLKFPIPVMEARSALELPSGREWQFELKWDGFRCLIFKDGKNVTLQSKGLKKLNRYFPEIVNSVKRLAAKRFILDGEIVIPAGRSISFDSLLQRIHPAASRITKLSTETPALFIAFDILQDADGTLLSGTTLSTRRERLDAFAAKHFTKRERFRLSPAARTVAKAKAWLRKSGNGLDGLIAKRIDLPYMSGERTGMQKIKFRKTADCVVGGFRYAAKGNKVGSLLLGLFDDDGLLHHVGYVSTAGEQKTAAFATKLKSLISAPGFTGKTPGGPSRWSTTRTAEWKPVEWSLVAEVEYDHLTGGRFRHGTRFIRWRPDKKAKQCTLRQVEQDSGAPLLLVH